LSRIVVATETEEERERVSLMVRFNQKALVGEPTASKATVTLPG